MERVLALIVAALSLPNMAAGAESVLTEQRFLSVLGTAHPAAVALTRDLGTAEAIRKQAGLLENPVFDYLREQPDGLPRETLWGLTWTPPLDGRRGLSIREAAAGLAAERADFAAELNRLRLEARGVFAAWSSGYYRVEILRDHKSRLDAIAERMLSRATAGEESRLDARRLQIAADVSAAELVDAEVDAAQAEAAVSAWISATETKSPVDFHGARPEIPGLPTVPADLDTSLRPDLTSATHRVEQAEAASRLSKRGLAAPGLVFGWKTIEGPIVDSDGPIFGLSWKIPLFNRRQPDRLEAESALQAAQAERVWLTERAKLDLQASKVAYTRLRRSALSAQEAVIGLDTAAMAATALYEQGESDVTDLLDTLQAVVEARLSALDLYIAALEAHRELEFAAGNTLKAGGVS